MNFIKNNCLYISSVLGHRLFPRFVFGNAAAINIEAQIFFHGCVFGALEKVTGSGVTGLHLCSVPRSSEKCSFCFSKNVVHF